jgi:hypothetical protein
VKLLCAQPVYHEQKLSLPILYPPIRKQRYPCDQASQHEDIRCVEVKSHIFLALHQMEVSDNIGITTAILLTVLKNFLYKRRQEIKMMICCTACEVNGKNISQDYWVFGLCPKSGILKNTTFWKLVLFPPSAERLGDTFHCTPSCYLLLTNPDLRVVCVCLY